jgi:hypothetical protein
VATDNPPLRPPAYTSRESFEYHIYQYCQAESAENFITHLQLSARKSNVNKTPARFLQRR